MILVFKTISPKRRDRLERLLKIEGIPYDIGGTGVNTKNFGFWVEESYADEARALVAKHRRELMLLEGPPWRFIAIAFSVVVTLAVLLTLLWDRAGTSP